MGFEKLKRLLDKLCIDYTEIKRGNGVGLSIDNLPVWIEWQGGEYLSILGLGYNSIFEYSAEYVANWLDKKFKEVE